MNEETQDSLLLSLSLPCEDAARRRPLQTRKKTLTRHGIYSRLGLWLFSFQNGWDINVCCLSCLLYGIFVLASQTDEMKCVSCSVMSDSLQHHGLGPARLLCPWTSPGKNTGVGSHSLLQGIFPGIKPQSPALQASSLPWTFVSTMSPNCVKITNNHHISKSNS